MQKEVPLSLAACALCVSPVDLVGFDGKEGDKRKPRTTVGWPCSHNLFPCAFIHLIRSLYHHNSDNFYHESNPGTATFLQDQATSGSTGNAPFLPALPLS